MHHSLISVFSPTIIFFSGCQTTLSTSKQDIVTAREQKQNYIFNPYTDI